MTIGGSYSAPRFDEKNKYHAYHEKFARFVLNNSVNNDWRNDYDLMQELYRFVDEGSDGMLTNHLQKAPDLTDLPGFWISLNGLPTKIDLLIGELETRGYDIRVRAMNKEAVSRRIEEKERLRVKRKLQPLFQTADQTTGLPIGEPEYIPQTESELNEYVDLSFKDKAELIFEGGLKWLAKRNSWDEERKAMFRDVMIVNRAISRDEIHRGLPRAVRVHPLNFIFDTSSKKDDLSDASYFGELEYVPLPMVAEKYGLSNSEIEKVYGSYNEFLGATPESTVGSTSVDYSYGFNTISKENLKWFRTINGSLKVLVAKAVWRDYKILNHKNETNKKYGSEHLQEIKGEPSKKDSDKVITNKLEVWRQCTIIGGTIVKEWGECPNQARSTTDLASTEPPYKVWIPNYSTGRGVSLSERIARVQLLKDIAMYNMELAMMRAGAKGISYDLAMVPPNWTPEQVMKYMKVHGVSFYNSKEYQFLPNNASPPFREFDMTIQNSINEYIKIMGYLDAEMDKISGVSPERQGTVQGASQGLGVTQAALFQSNLITQPYYVSFERFCSRIQNAQAKLMKMSWAGKELYSPIIGDIGVDFIKTHFDLELEDVGVVVESLPPIFQDRVKLEQMISLAVQSDPTFINDALAILVEPDTRVAIRKFQRKTAMRKIFEAQQAQAQQEQQAALEQRLAALEGQRQQAEIQGDLMLQESKNTGAMERSNAQGRVKLASDQIKAVSDVFNRPPNPTTSSKL
jgi:hypothetical protein